MDIRSFSVEDKIVTLYLSPKECAPLVVVNHYSKDEESVVDTLRDIGATDFNLLSVTNLNWNHDLTPWSCPALSPKEPPFSGGADAYLELMLTKIIPKAREFLKGEPLFLTIAGYSLAGLFALYALYRTDTFLNAASISGSLWYPDFKEYCLAHEFLRKPQKIYLSVGDKEALTKNKMLCTVQENTRALAAHYKSLGLFVTYELNPGNHFKDNVLRSAKGILKTL